MKNIICFGAGAIGRRYIEHFATDNVLAFADNDANKWNTTFLGHKIIAPDAINNYSYDKIIITIDDLPPSGLTCEAVNTIRGIYNQLIEMGVESDKIQLQYVGYWRDNPRIVFLRHLSELFRESNTEGSIAECGVFRGCYSAYLNEYFSERKLYLFDTFEGFQEEDMKAETHDITIKWLNMQETGILATGSEFITLLRCQHRENVIIKKGQVPHSLVGCEDEKFAFVNLDMDLYVPQLAALRFFAPRMSPGGVILLHDYYYTYTPGVKQAVNEFAQERELTRVPIGDGDDGSIALIF